VALQTYGAIMINFTNSDWIAIIGVGVAIIFGILQFFNKTPKSTKKNKFNISQKSGNFSKGDQKQSVRIDVNE